MSSSRPIQIPGRDDARAGRDSCSDGGADLGVGFAVARRELAGAGGEFDVVVVSGAAVLGGGAGLPCGDVGMAAAGGSTRSAGRGANLHTTIIDPATTTAAAM
jgi:hypothetical protein